MTVVEHIGFYVTIQRFTTGMLNMFGGVIIEHNSCYECLYPGPDFGASSLGRCCGTVHVTDVPDRPKWTVISENPLTLTPSIECKCKRFHGHITDGRWVPV